MSRSLRTAAAATALGSFVFLVVAWAAHPWVFGDTPFVLDGSNALLTCLKAGDYNACGFTGKLNFWGLMSPMGDWSLLQHLPDLATIGLGANGHPVRTDVLVALTIAAMVGSVLLGRLVLGRVGQAAWFWAFLLLVLTSPFVWWARTTAGEPLAAGLLVALVAAAVLRAPGPVLALAAAGASFSKETSYPFVAVVALLGLDLARRRTGLPIRRHIWWGAAGIVFAFALTSLFNIVRFGSVLNANLFEDKLHTPGIARPLEYTGALFFAPSGGIFVFWPSASILVLAACIVGIRRAGARRPAIVIAGVALTLAFGFATWYTPFGWNAYGPRFSLPWVLPLALLALVAYGSALGELVRTSLASLPRLVVVAAVCVVFTLPHVGQLWRPHEIDAFFDPPCDSPWHPGTTIARFHDCQHELMWRARPMSLYAVKGIDSPAGIATAGVLTLGVLACLLVLREDVVRASRWPVT